MAKRKKPQEPRPQLTRFLLVGINAANSYSGQGVVRVNLRRENDIEIATLGPGEGHEASRVAVRLKMAIVGRREGEEEDGLHIEGLYEGRFVFPPDVSVAELDQLADDTNFQYRLVSQVVPLASAHLKDQLELMGLSASRMPLGL